MVLIVFVHVDLVSAWRVLYGGRRLPFRDATGTYGSNVIGAESVERSSRMPSVADLVVPVLASGICPEDLDY